MGGKQSSWFVRVTFVWLVQHLSYAYDCCIALPYGVLFCSGNVMTVTIKQWNGAEKDRSIKSQRITAFTCKHLNSRFLAQFESSVSNANIHTQAHRPLHRHTQNVTFSRLRYDGGSDSADFTPRDGCVDWNNFWSWKHTTSACCASWVAERRGEQTVPGCLFVLSLILHSTCYVAPRLHKVVPDCTPNGPVGKQRVTQVSSRETLIIHQTLICSLSPFSVVI